MRGKNLFSANPHRRYNVAAWQDTESGNVFMVTREVEKPGEQGEPDIGKLVLLEFDIKGEMINEKVVWHPAGDSLWLEDPRALALEDGSVIMGLTAVLREKNGYSPYPAITRLVTRTWREVLPAITIIETFGPGKNTTPIDAHHYFCRPEREGYFHKLLIFSFRNLIAKKIQDLEFPVDLPWAQWRIGTTMPPIWIDDEKALMIFHGITKQDGKYIYSLGRAGLFKTDGQFRVIAHPEPILTPDDFVDKAKKPQVEELHPELRRVVYACGGVVKHHQQDLLTLYVNVGDVTTFEVEFAIADLTRGLF